MSRRRLSTEALGRIGTLLALAYLFAMPVLFVVVELLAVQALGAGSWLAWALLVIVVWNVWVLSLRAWQLARVVKP